VSNHVRIIATHPLYGVLLNSQACTVIEGQFALSRQFCDVKWPRWKRIVWLAKSDPRWKVRVFRVPRKSKLRKSIFGREILLTGSQLPPKRKKRKKRNKNSRVHGWKVGQLIDAVRAKKKNFVDEDAIYDPELLPIAPPPLRPRPWDPELEELIRHDREMEAIENERRDREMMAREDENR